MRAAGAGEGSGPKPRAAVAAIDPYVPGAVPPAVERALKLASNENPFGPSPLAVAAARAVLEGVNRYPEAGAPTLRAKLAARLRVAPDQILVGAGSDETLHLLANAYLEPGRHAVMADPAYGIHRISARAAGAAVTLVPCADGVHDLPAMAAAARAAGAPGVVYVANPHNPTGTVVAADGLAALLDGMPPDWLVVVDEAYVEFVEPAQRFTALDLLDRHPGLVVTRTFSKAYGLAGMRVGYAVASSEVLEPVGRIRPPFNVSTPTLAAAAAALDDEAHLARTVRDTLASRDALCAALARLGLRFLPTQANFVLVEDRDGWPAALAADAIAVRPGADLGVPGWTRISLPRPEDVERLVEVIAWALEVARS
jgi:histidinol-phosphate aminotransferase